MEESERWKEIYGEFIVAEAFNTQHSRTTYMMIADAFTDAGWFREAGLAAKEAGDYMRAGCLFRKGGAFQYAGMIYKQAGAHEDSKDCYEKARFMKSAATAFPRLNLESVGKMLNVNPEMVHALLGNNFR